ncbi:MAG: 50S ribosomal protein L25 [Patescibacteria group bacterium]|jgi:large subunit ribosomal protein L25
MAENSMKNLLKAVLREPVGKQVEKIRRDSKIPAVLYGRAFKNVNLLVDYKEFEKIFRQAGTSSLVDLVIGDQPPVKVLIHDIQKHPVSDKLFHIDFLKIKMDEKIITEIELSFVGESKAVKESGGILVKNLTHLKIESLPQDLVHEIQVDISSLMTFEDAIRLRDIKLPKGISLKEKEDIVVVKVQPPRTEEELKALEEKPEETVEEVAKVGEDKKEEGEAAEGEEGEADKKAEKKDEKKPEKK